MSILRGGMSSSCALQEVWSTVEEVKSMVLILLPQVIVTGGRLEDCRHALKVVRGDGEDACACTQGEIYRVF